VVPAIKELLLALSAPGDGVIIQRPVYYPFSILIEKTGRRVVNNALVNTDGRYTIDFQDLENKARDPATTMMLFCSPHNPVGRVWSREELEQVGRICLEHDVLLVSDEIHCDLLRAGVRHFPLTTLFPDNDTIITCTSPSKTFNCAGMQIANIIIENKILQEKWTDMVGPELSSPLALAAVRGAYEGGGAWLQQLRKYLDDNVLFLQHFLRTELPETRFTVPEGTYLAWIDFSNYGYSNRELSDLLVTGARVLLEDGLMFGSEGNGFQRMNIACPRSILKTGLQQMAATLHPG
jgi:cystathionine beta-lyase